MGLLGDFGERDIMAFETVEKEVEQVEKAADQVASSDKQSYKFGGKEYGSVEDLGKAM